MAILHLRQWFRWRWIAGLAAIGLVLIAAVWGFGSVPGNHDAAAPVPTATRTVVAKPARTSETIAPLPAVAAAAAPAALNRPVSRLDFDSADDLYALATAAANSNDPMTLHNGRHATLSCLWTPQDRAKYEALISAGRGDDVSEERKRAAKVVLRKCAGFFNNDAAANDALRRRLRDGLLAHEGEYIPGSGMPSDKQLAVAMERGDWQAFTSAFSNLSPRIHARAGIAPKSEAALLYGVAWLQAGCDLGQDCSPNGLSYAIQCAMHVEMCAGSWEAFNKREISETQQVQISRLRREIVDAYRRKDAAYFGLSP